MGTLIFNGVSTLDLGVVIQTPPVYEFPSKRFDVVQIQGRNGDLIIDKNSFNNVNREYNLASVFRKNDSFIENVRVLVDWLSSASGYARLEDSYEPDYFRLAMYRSGGQLPNFYDQATAMIVKFECKPQRFLKSGEIQLDVDFTGIWVEIINPTKYVALPEIEIVGGFTYIDVANGVDHNNPDGLTRVTLDDPSIAVETIIIDSDLQDAYTPTKYVNNEISISNGFVTLQPGSNWIKINPIVGDGTTSVKIKPRWWVL